MFDARMNAMDLTIDMCTWFKVVLGKHKCTRGYLESVSARESRHRNEKRSLECKQDR